ncbi:MAG: alkaline phosphatase [Bacteroidales bacterium]|nr:alkaline phosphatase [Bacteroidales bacterium]
MKTIQNIKPITEKMKSISLLIILTIAAITANSQDSYMNKDSLIAKTYFKNTKFHEPVLINKDEISKTSKPKNVILFIGDGMSFAQVSAALTANKGKLNLNYFEVMGMSKTSSASDFVTDSGAGGTAISTGKKTYNKAIAVGIDSLPMKTILEICEENKFSTGLVATAVVTHATPASFIAHNKYRYNYEEIALDFLKTNVEVVIGGGRNHFTKRKDGRNLLSELIKQGYDVSSSIDEKIKAKKFICLTDSLHPPIATERGDYLPNATKKAIGFLAEKKAPFFLMVEGSQIDWGGHDLDLPYVVNEMLDFDRAIGVALEFAAENGETLIIVTADHECGGLSILNGNEQTGEVWGAFSSDDHSPIMVPVFAIGPGSEKFRGIYENTKIFYCILDALNIKP